MHILIQILQHLLIIHPQGSKDAHCQETIPPPVDPSDKIFLNAFATRYNEVRRERTRKWLELNKGKAVADSYVDHVDMTYNISTCPGSSGCAVVSLIVNPGDETLRHKVPHSRARTMVDGLSGGGYSYRVS